MGRRRRRVHLLVMSATRLVCAKAGVAVATTVASDGDTLSAGTCAKRGERARRRYRTRRRRR
eukprot:3350637-Pleurochrysis_carterae.AAC.1